MDHFIEQARRIRLAYSLAFVSRVQYTIACTFKLFKQDEKAVQILLKSFKTSMNAMNALDEWNDNRKVLDLATGFKIAFYKANLETMIQELEED